MDNKVHRGDPDAGYLSFHVNGQPCYYRITDETVTTDRGEIPLAEYIGDHTPEQYTKQPAHSTE